MSKTMDGERVVPEPTFEKVDMQALMDEGVLMAANEAFFWPHGLALTWTVDKGRYEGALHIREWVYEDGHQERIELDPDDEVGKERRKRYRDWLNARIALMPDDERGPALAIRLMLAVAG